MRLIELVYVANIIDYVRILMLYWAVRSTGYTFAAYYAISYLLDAVDGPAARALNQESRLGYYLDMVADRVSSCVCLYFAAQAVLAGETCVGASVAPYVAGMLLASIVAVELVAHSVVMYLSEVRGVHQKQMGFDYRIVRMYLSDKKCLFLSCVSFECFSLGLVVNAPAPLLLVSLPGFLFRGAANLCRLLAICTMPAATKDKDAEEKDDKSEPPRGRAASGASGARARTASPGAQVRQRRSDSAGEADAAASNDAGAAGAAAAH
eukprot:TRINITY_DN29510_c0_g1_i1.p1 TRINITY_DN29510_c0_g1~~TRINITY_DN29510_c0_g1_i1.p1  ORF type:complete len:299 (-),score=55.70 TRINITY_DN29510_c0_g1_i1:96-890(-)